MHFFVTTWCYLSFSLFFIFLLHAFCFLSLISPIYLIMLFWVPFPYFFSLSRYSFMLFLRYSNCSYCAITINAYLTCNSLECSFNFLKRFFLVFVFNSPATTCLKCGNYLRKYLFLHKTSDRLLYLFCS